MLKTKYLFELSVYRLTEEKYYNDRKKYIENINLNNPFPVDDKYLHKNYGGDWQYNEIIGFLKFYQYGCNQMRCYYSETDAIKKVKTRTKQFVQISDSYCNKKFSKESSNEELIQIIKECVEHCQVRLNKKKRYIDTTIFNNLVDNVAWNNVLL